MDHPIIVNAFKKAYERNNEKINEKIYLSFYRPNIFYKDTYCILKGTYEDINIAIANWYKKIIEEKREYPRADHIELLDTPFDTWCGGICELTGKKCSNETIIKCNSQWTHVEHNSEEELDEYIKNIKPGYYPNYDIEYII